MAPIAGSGDLLDHPGAGHSRASDGARSDFEGALAAAASRSSSDSGMHVTLVVTSAAKAPSLLQLLRSRAISNCWGLAGRMSEHEWMLRALSFVVATPEEVCGRALFSSRLEALVLDRAAVAQDAFLHELLYEAQRGKLPVFPAQPQVPDFWRPWQPGASATKGFVDPRDRFSVEGELRSSLEKTLPEVLSCSDLGDSWFDSAVEGFTGGDSIVQRGWSAVLSYMPGVFRGIARGDKSLTLVLAPECRAAGIAQFMQAFARHFGLPEELVGLEAASRVAVGSPGRFHATNRLSDVRQLIVVEADKLFAAHRNEMEWIVERLDEDVQIGVHSETTLSPELEGLASRFAGGRRWQRLNKAGASMDGVRQFYAGVDDGSCKLDELCRLCRELRRRFKVQAVVVCNSSARAVEVAAEMRERGLTALAMHSGMDEREVELVKRSEQRPVIMTDHGCSKGARDVINFEMPQSPGDYFERASKLRDQVTKVVISLVAGGQECELLDRVRSLYGVDIDLLPCQPKRYLYYEDKVM